MHTEKAAGKGDPPGLDPVGLGSLGFEQALHLALGFAFVENVRVFLDGTVVEQAGAGDAGRLESMVGLGDAPQADAVVEACATVAKGGGIDGEEDGAETGHADRDPKVVDFFG